MEMHDKNILFISLKQCEQDIFVYINAHNYV